MDVDRSTPGRQALVVIDMQRDYLAGGELARCRDELVGAVDRLVRAACRHGVLVVEVRTEHDPAGRSWTLSMLEDGGGPAIAGTEGCRRAEGLASLDSATIVVLKQRDSAFFQTTLAAQLRQRGIDHLVLSGVSTESCVAATASDAFSHNFAVTLVSDATASSDPSLHGRALDRMRQQYRQRVATSDEVVAGWSGTAPGERTDRRSAADLSGGPR